MNEFRADLHCHSTCSDGTESPEELIDHALRIGLSGLSITDHDSVTAYKTAIPYAKAKGLELIVGAEFSAVHFGKSAHILAYSFDWNHPEITSLTERHTKRRLERNAAILEKLAERGMLIKEEELLAENTTGRPHIADAMVKKGFVKDINQAFLQWIGDGKPCYVRGNPISAEETIAAIHAAGGFAVLAHPHLIKDSLTVLSLLKLPFDGLECYYGRFMLHQEEQWVKIAKNKKWLATGGSDYHGTVKPDVKLGSSWVDEQTFRLLQRHGSP